MSDLDHLARRLRERIRGQIHEGYPLAPHTSYHVGGPADLAVLPDDTEDLAEVIALADEAGVPLAVLGGGSNVLVSDRGLRGAVILTPRMQKLEVQGFEVVAGAGAESHLVAQAALGAGLSGVEFLAWLPGSIGGACYMNARAYGGEIAQVLARATVVTRRGAASSRTLGPHLFSYKSSPFQETGEIIAEITLRLVPGDPRAIQERMDQILEERHAKHELDFPSCGCVFKNDHSIGISSGKLIERCALKGFRIGDAQVSPYHANFIINLGQASAREIRQVIDHVRRTVAEQTGHELELEVQLVGDWD